MGILAILGSPRDLVFTLLLKKKKKKITCQNLKKLLDLITKTRLYNFDPLNPHFYIVKLGFTGVYIIFSYFVEKRRLWVLVRIASVRRF